MKTLISFFILILLFSCSTKEGKSRLIKTITTENYSISVAGDTIFQVESIEYHNRKGKLDSTKKYNEGGRLSEERFFQYNDKGLLTQTNTIDHFAKDSVENWYYEYNGQDSLIHQRMQKSDFGFDIKITRNPYNQVIVKEIKTLKDTLIEIDSLEYTIDGQLNIYRRFDGHNNLVYRNEKKFSRDLLLEESILKPGPSDTSTVTIKYFYNSLNQLDSSRQQWENESSFHLMRYSYHDNGTIKQTTRKCIGCSRSAIVIQEFDGFGNLTLYKNIDFESTTFETSYAYDYDNRNNWIHKKSNHKANPIKGIQRVIVYY